MDLANLVIYAFELSMDNMNKDLFGKKHRHQINRVLLFWLVHKIADYFWTLHRLLCELTHFILWTEWYPVACTINMWWS